MVAFVLSLAWGRSTQVILGQIRSKFQIQNFSLKNVAILSSFFPGFQKRHLFLRSTIRNAINCISNRWCHHLYLVFWPFDNQKWKYCLGICYVCCLYAALQHLFYFLELQNIGFYRHSILDFFLNFGDENRGKINIWGTVNRGHFGHFF